MAHEIEIVNGKLPSSSLVRLPGMALGSSFLLLQLLKKQSRPLVLTGELA
jgi:hypothetical protein